ncbi:uncharacterized protein ACRADG_007211 [Cochliomyia hominivorax]
MFLKILIIFIICALLKANELDYNNTNNNNNNNNNNIYKNYNNSNNLNNNNNNITEINKNFINNTNDVLNLESNTNPEENRRRNKSIFIPPPRQAANCGYKHNGKLLKC